MTKGPQDDRRLSPASLTPTTHRYAILSAVESRKLKVSGVGERTTTNSTINHNILCRIIRAYEYTF